MKINLLHTSPVLNFGKVFDVRKIKNLHCPICGSMMFNHEQSSQFCKEMSKATGNELIEVIEKYENLNSSDNSNLPVFNSKQQEILNRIKSAAKDNEEMDLEDIVYYLGEEVAYKYSSFSTREILSNYRTSYYDSKPILNDEDYAEVFFLNCRNKGFSSYEVARDFIKNKYPTIEHIVPASKSGKNDKSNYLCDCNECNGLRGSMPFDDWIKNIPNFENNLQIQINEINKALSSSTLDKSYSTYPKALVETINELSQRKINIIV